MNFKTLTVIAPVCFVAAMTHGQTPEDATAATTSSADRGGGMAIEDMRAAIQMRFDRMDADGDGFVSKKEFPGPRRRASGNQRPSGDADSRTGERRAAGERPPRRQGRMPMQWRSFDDYDSNKDGQVSKDEMAAPIDELASLDANGDGRLDRSEMQAMRPSRDASKKMKQDTE